MYMVIGGWNSLFTFLCFSVLYFLLSPLIPSYAILIMVWAIASANGYLGFRRLVFTPMRHPAIEYLRYQVVYLPLLVLNIVALPLALAHTSLSAYAIQAFLSVFAAIAAYFGNKYFTFGAPKTGR
jgi:putative flippase GtrA